MYKHSFCKGEKNKNKKKSYIKYTLNQQNQNYTQIGN